jgi:hypothetical protein
MSVPSGLAEEVKIAAKRRRVRKVIADLVADAQRRRGTEMPEERGDHRAEPEDAEAASAVAQEIAALDP